MGTPVGISVFFERTIVVFAKEGVLSVGYWHPTEETLKVIDFNHYLEMVDAPFRVYLTDDENLLSMLNLIPPGEMPDAIVPQDSE